MCFRPLDKRTEREQQTENVEIHGARFDAAGSTHCRESETI